MPEMPGGFNLRSFMSRLRTKYQEEIVPKLKEEFKIANSMAVPRLEKIVINVGAGEAKENQAMVDKVIKDLTALSGQRAVVTKAKKSIAGFKLSKGQSVGAMVTLRGERMYDFLDKLGSVVLPKVRDFRGLPGSSFDSRGNFNFGIREQTIFPEIEYTSGNADKGLGLQISIVTTAKNHEQGRRLLKLLGMPLKEEE